MGASKRDTSIWHDDEAKRDTRTVAVTSVDDVFTHIHRDTRVLYITQIPLTSISGLFVVTM